MNMNNINQKIANLSPEKRALLELKLKNKNNKKNKNTNTPKYQEISPRGNHDLVPLSFAQERLWFLDQLEPGKPFYTIVGAVLLQGNLNLQILQQSLSEIVQRHEVLRTSFCTVDGKPIQVIHPQATMNIKVVDLQQHSEKERETILQQQVELEASTPFDLEIAPLVKCILLQLDATEYVLLLTMHHIVSDGWSMGVLIQEISALYQAFCAGEPSPLPQLPIQYADFAVWQRQWLSGEVLQNQLNYWCSQLDGAPQLLQLPTDGPRPTVQTYRGGTETFSLNSDLSQKLQTLSRESGTTLFMTLEAAFATLLYRYSGQSDILIGSPIANRNRSEIESLIGFFVNTLVLRTTFVDNPSFQELLAQVRETTLAAYEHQDVPFEQVVEALQPQRSLSHSPLFQVMFVLQNAPMGKVELPGVTLSELNQENAIAKFDLTLSISETDQGLLGSWEYNSDLFNESTIERMASHFQNLLSAIVENPQQTVSEIPLLSDKERHQLLVEWNDTQSEYPSDKCIHQLFEQQVERTPDAIAVVFEKEQLTYQQLNQRANQLANHLQTIGVEPEALVGICVERSLEMVVGILGILKAGGAYVPLDPNYPQERLSYVLADSGIEVLLTQQSLLSSLPSHNALLVCLDRDWKKIEQHSQNNLKIGVYGDNLAYVIYTSGSTGQPKGVLVEHKNVVRLFAATQSWYNFNGNDVWTNFHSIAFDFSVWEIWGALLHGGKLVIVPYWISRDTQSFYNLLGAENVTVLNQTPSAFGQLIQTEQSHNTQAQLNLRLVIFGGEALDLQTLKPWFEKHPEHSPQLVNMYGITETTVHVTYRPLTMLDLNSSGSVIGRPIADLQMYILDDNLQPVPIGVTGQMYVGGAGVTRGYLNRQQLNLERFIPNPFNQQQQNRLYKTGDLARYLPNGDIEYLGRIDNQVKIRGFRIELGEIEAALTTHPQIQQAVVIATEDIPGNKRLVAYVVTSDELNITQQLREYLKQKLPEYMVPGAFVTLESLPLTANGKIDRKALPALDAQRLELNTDFVAPRTLEEELLAQIWSEVLGVKQVGIYDNFFELGGDSLLSVQVLAKANKSGLGLSLQQLFENQTIHSLVKVLQQSELLESIVRTAPLSLISSEQRQSLPNGVEDAYPLTRLQLGMLFHSEYAPETAVYHDVMSYYLKAPLNVQVLHSAIEQIVARHPVLRTSIAMTRFAQPLQLVHSQVSIELTADDLSSLPLDEQHSNIATWIEQEKQRPFSWDAPPLARFHIHQRSDDSFNFSLSCHHAILDGWSVATLLMELLQHYFFLLDETVPPLGAAPNLTFRDYVAKEQETLQSQECQQYWHEKLADFTVTKLPRWADNQQRELREQINQQEVEISPALSAQLKQFATKVGVPLKSVLLAAHLRVMNFLSNQADITTGVVTHGRPAVEDSERVLGLFLNTMPLRMQLSGGTWVELVEQTFDIERETLPFQQYPLAQLQQEVGLGQPLFETIFNYINFHVYQGLSGIDNLEFKGGQFFDQTNFTFAVQFSVNPITAEISLSLTYEPNQFSFEQVKSIGGYYSAVLLAMVTQPQERYEQVCLLSKTERHQLLVEWNHTATEYPSDKCIHQLFEQQVEKTPDAVAVVFDGEQLTYQQLNIRANQLAHHLKTLGVGPEVLVGICVERSLEMVVGLLGILKAGGAYVPLDPNYPNERLSYMLGDSQLPILLTQKHLLKQLPEHQTQTICLDEDWQNYADYSQKNPDSKVQPDNLAYVIYTSGSTGKPKGTMILHSGMVNYLSWCKKAYNVADGEGSTVNSSIGFDATITSLFSPLLVGRKIVLLPESGEIEELRKALCSGNKFSLVKITPAHLEILSHLLADEQVNIQVQAFIIGGEALSQKVTSFWQQRTPHTRLINEYGPTETVVGCCIYEVGKQNFPGGNIPIGRPIANTELYILDNHLQPVPIGVVGELYIGGAGVARGYLNRPELTSERFIDNPFNESKLYKTGDLACYLPNGNIEFLGRIDNQVKIRGFRIELGEIEAVLSTHPQIQQAVVIATEEIPGNKRLVAYIVASDKSLTANQLREFLKQKLPEYMVPAAFVTLDTLPLTPNGKVDRKALPRPDGEITRKQEYVAPRTPSEEIIANIFADVLGVKNVGIHDNFFELGGHSLLATQLISRLRLAWELDIPLRVIFESPTVAQLDQALTHLRTTNSSLSLPPIQTRQTHTEQLPLSWAQERLWFLNQLEGESATYNIPGAIRISGNLDINALQQALSEIVRRHEVLRTSFCTVDGKPIQVIHPVSTINIKVVDLQQHPEKERQTLLQQLAQQEAITPFDLEIAPLTRCNLLCLDATRYVLLLTMHHIVSDGWSLGVLIQEISALYQAFCAGEPSPLPQLPIQYADFAVWQRQWLSGEVLQNQLNYWCSQLDGAPQLLQLPTDGPRPTVQTYRGGTETFSLNSDLSQKLQTLSRESGTTLFMTLEAAFATLLYRYSGQSDILIGSPIANRNRSEIESLIGFFVNTLVLRTTFVDNPSFQELLAQVRETTLAAYEHQDVPFEQVVEALQPQRSLSHSPLFQVMFVLQNAPMGEVELPGVTLSELNQESTIAKFDLTLSITETDQGLVGSWEYNSDLFDSSTIERMAGHYQNLLSAIVENPQQVVGELPLLSEAERHQLLVEWNDTSREYPTDKCIHQLFEQQVEKTPDATAVVFEEEQLTYQQLNQRANQLAHHLVSLGVGPEVLVGICVERSVEMVVGLLGILKAGGAYVPLDPNYPPERLSYMLTDSGVRVLLTTQKLLEHLPEDQARVVCLDVQSVRHSLEQHHSNNLDLGISSNNLAYIIYTSGSTGKPKGVMIEHQALVNHMSWMESRFPLEEVDKVIQKTPFSFDASVWEFYAPLLVGSQLVIAKPGGDKNSDYLVQEISKLKITTIQVVPSLLRMLLETPEIENCQSLKQVFCGGEILPVELVKDFRKKLDAQLNNIYGPTEATIDTTFFKCEEKFYQSTIPIGRPISNAQIYILDSHLQPLPVGVPGELYIGGDGLARGYLNRPELTSEKFIQNPFSNSFADRLYKTGDLARYDCDGNIEFLGRIDNQVKIRGFRIELGEIEAVLNSHPQIQQAVSIATEDTSGNKGLVAYVVFDDESATTKEIREFLRHKLPDYMIPGVFVSLDSLPLTPNGKVDRKALPIPEKNFTRENEYVAPRTTIELQLTQIWSSVLNITSVGVQDNFFELGGHSLLAVRLMSLIQQQFQINLPLATLFQSPTIEQLAVVVSSDSSKKLWSPLVPIQPKGSLPPLFCIPGVGGNALYFYHLARSLGDAQPFYSLQAQGFDGETEPLGSIEEIASQYIKAIQTVQPVGPYFLAGHSFGGKVAFEMANQLQHQGQSVAYLAILDTSAPISQVNHKHDDSNGDNAGWIYEIAQFFQSWEEFYGENLQIFIEALTSLTPEKQINYFKQQLEIFDILPPQTNIKLVRGLLQVFRTQSQINYLPHNTSRTPITLFRAQEVNSEFKNSSHLFWDPAWGWNQFSDGEVEIHTVPGSHLSMMNKPHVEVLAQKLRKSLEQAQTNQF